MIRIENLDKRYLRGDYSVEALSGITCDIREGEIFSVIGKSGSGKSTLLNLIGGLDRPSSGHIYFNEKDLMTMSRNELANHRKKNVGMVFQSFNLIFSMTALENVSLALAFGGVSRPQRKRQAAGILERVGLSERMHHKPDELSGGEAQRVAIARAIANHPSVILADEPTGNLDSSTSQEIIRLLKDLNSERGLSLLLVTHDVDTARQLSDHIIRLQDGKVVEDVRPKEKN